MSVFPPSEWDPIAAAIIRDRSLRLIGRAGFRSQDLPDLEQSLAAELLDRMPAFDPAKGDRSKFLRMIVYRAAARLLRDRRAAKRAVNPVSLEVDLLDRDPDDPDQVLDLSEAVADLPHDLRIVAERLRWDTITGVAQTLGIARSTVHRRIRAIRRRFEERGLNVFFGQFPRQPGNS